MLDVVQFHFAVHLVSLYIWIFTSQSIWKINHHTYVELLILDILFDLLDNTLDLQNLIAQNSWSRTPYKSILRYLSKSLL